MKILLEKEQDLLFLIETVLPPSTFSYTGCNRVALTPPSVQEASVPNFKLNREKLTKL